MLGGSVAVEIVLTVDLLNYCPSISTASKPIKQLDMFPTHIVLMTRMCGGFIG